MVPMGEIDKTSLQHSSDEALLLSDVIAGDHELLFLDSYLQDILGLDN